MFEVNAFFWYRLVFMAELIVAEWMYAFCLKKRKLYWLRSLGAVAVCLCAALFIPVPWRNALYSSLLFFILFIVSVLVMKACYDERWINIIFCALAAYITRHVAYTLYNIVIMSLGMGEGLLISIYGDYELQFNAFTTIVYVNCYFFTYWLMLLFMGYRLRGYEELELESSSFLVLAAFIVLVDIVLNALVVYYSYDVFDRMYLIFLSVYNIFCSMLAFIIQFGMVSRKMMQNRLDIITELWNKDREQYIIAKDNIERINMICHDMKYRLRSINGGKGGIDSAEIAEMERAISKYDAGIKTGNDALNVIMTEKSFICGSKEIRFTCMADGAAMNFMSDADIYSLFGNALDNAIEACERITDTEKRMIGVTVRRVDDFLTVNIYNYYETELKFSGGFPLTTKKDNASHGFGIRSIGKIIEKYGGDMSIVTKDGIFNLNMLFYLHAQGHASNG